MTEWRVAYAQVLSFIFDLRTRAPPEMALPVAETFDLIACLFPQAYADFMVFCRCLAVGNVGIPVSAVLASVVAQTDMTSAALDDLIMVLYAGNLFVADGQPVVMPRDAAKFGPHLSYICNTLLSQLRAMNHSGPFTAEHAAALAMAMVVQYRCLSAAAAVAHRPPATSCAA
jgi:hypothetical protein